MGYELMRINDMGLYRLYRRIPDVKHEFRWKTTPEEQMRESLMDMPIDKMGIYLALRDFRFKFDKEEHIQRRREREQKLEWRKNEARNMAARGFSVRQIAKELGLSDTAIRRYLDESRDQKIKQQQVKNLAERKALARKMAAEGMTRAKIAEELGVCVASVYNYLASEWHDDEK